MDRICDFLERERVKVPGLSVPAQYDLRALLPRGLLERDRALPSWRGCSGSDREEIFAAGDHFNDLPMLDGRHARWVACPGNAVEEVQTPVRAAQGYVASRECSEGVLEALHHFGLMEPARDVP